MELAQLTLLAFALLLLAVILLGSGMAMQRNKKKKEAGRIAEDKRRMRSTETIEAPFAQPAGQDADTLPKTELPAAPTAPAAGGALEILRVFRDPVDASLSLQVMDRTAGSAAEMSPAQLEQLRRVLAELGDWAGGTTGPRRNAPQAPIVDPVEWAPAESPVEPAPGSFADSLPPPVEIEDVLPFRRKKMPKLDKAPEPPKPIAEQINAIVQRMLAASPLAGRGVRLSQDLQGGLRIVDGVRHYTSIDEIEDPPVKALIKAAVQEWNEKNRPSPRPPGRTDG